MITGILAYGIRGFFPNIPHFPLGVFIQYEFFFGLSIIVSALIIGVYRATLHSNTARHYFLAGKAYLYSILVLFSFLYFFRYYDFPRRYTVIFFLVLPLLFFLGRVFLNKFIQYMQQHGYGNHNVLLAGYDDGGLEIIHRSKNFPKLGYDIKGIVTNQRSKVLTPVEIHGTLVPRHPLSELERLVSEYRIDRVFVPSWDTITNGYSEIFALCRKKCIKLKVLSEDSDSLLRLSHVYDIAGVTIYSPERKRIDLLKRIFKRTFDVIVAVLVLILISPILGLTVFAILIESGKPVLFKQRRASIKGEKIFNFIKFRSMVNNADEIKESLFQQNETDGALFKIKNDPRMTKVGKIIRKLSIDELPQLLNVIKGEMSIVGPRPLPVEDLEKVKESKEFWKSIKDREKVKPGITGLWQISGRSKVGFSEMICLDLYYVENQSLLFDLEIIFATIPVVLFGKGAY
jgi:exopolysaccharide biosynthesis polyprenyl glycosylphosphotransferase